MSWSTRYLVGPPWLCGSLCDTAVVPWGWFGVRDKPKTLGNCVDS